MGVEVPLGLFPVTATSAVQGLIVGVVERSVAGVDFRLALGSAHRAGYRTVIHLGSDLNLRRIACFSFRPLPLLQQGVLRFVFIPAPFFFRAALVSGERLIVSIFPLGLSQNLEAEGKMRGVGGMGGLGFWNAKPRRSAEAGQDSFPWPTTPIAASLN